MVDVHEWHSEPNRAAHADDPHPAVGRRTGLPGADGNANRDPILHVYIDAGGLRRVVMECLAADE
jgi:hypothetical protein